MTNITNFRKHIAIECDGREATTLSLVGVSDQGRLALGKVVGVTIRGVEGVNGCPVSVEIECGLLSDWVSRLWTALNECGVALGVEQTC